jgi:hypothetical protein
MFLRRLPDKVKLMLAEDHSSSVTELAARADILTASAPKPAATVAAVPAPVAEIAAVGQKRPAKKEWHPRKPEDRKRPRSGDGGRGGRGDAKRKPPPPAEPWKTIGICFFHHTYGDQALKCEPPCLLAGN